MGTLENKNSITLAQFAQTLSAIIGKKECNIQAHSERVANYSREIAKRHGLSEEEQNNIFVMGLLHDIGKIGISEMILNKPGRLMEMEEEILKRHTLIGEEMSSSPYNNRGKYYNIFFDFETRYYNDNFENAIVFGLD